MLPNGDLLVQRVNANRQSQLHRFSPVTGRLDPLPAIPDSTLSDDSVVVSADGRLAYYFGQPLDDLSSPPAFYKVDLQTGRNQPVSLTLDLKPPVSLAFDLGYWRSVRRRCGWRCVSDRARACGTWRPRRSRCSPFPTRPGSRLTDVADCS